MNNIKFYEKAIRQLYSTMVMNESSDNNKELIMCIYSIAVARHYDTRDYTSFSKEELAEISKTTRIYKDENGEDAKPNYAYLTKSALERITDRMIGKSDEEKWIILTKDILERTRKQLCHGEFDLAKRPNGKDIVIINDKVLRIEYDFNCLCDICETIADKDKTKDLMELIERIKSKDKFDVISNEKDKGLFFYVYSMVALAFAEKEYLNRLSEYASFFGLPQDKSLSKNLRTIRNGVTHNYWNIKGNKIEVEDYEDISKTIQSGDITLNFDKIIKGAALFSKIPINKTLNVKDIKKLASASHGGDIE